MTDFPTAVIDYGMVTALPAAPGHNHRCTYTDSLTAPTYRWRFQYNSSSTKWECIGGTPIYASIDGSSSTRSASTYGDLADAQTTSVTVPLAGDYEIQFGCFAENTAGVLQDGFCAVKLGAAATSDAESFKHTSNEATYGSNDMRMIKRTGLAASTVLKLEFRASAGSTNFNFGRRFISVLPVRVG